MDFSIRNIFRIPNFPSFSVHFPLQISEQFQTMEIRSLSENAVNAVVESITAFKFINGKSSHHFFTLAQVVGSIFTCFGKFAKNINGNKQNQI